MAASVRCLVCLKEMGRVSHTHLKTHNMTIAQYKERFPDARFAYHPDSQREKIRANSSRTEKIRANKIEYWSTRKGQTLEELRGAESAAITRQKLSLSLSGDKNPAFGKVYDNAGGRNVGWYKGFIFRSLYEYSYLKFLESMGKNLEKDVISEPYSIPFEFEGVERTFHPDFEIDGIGVVEIKSVYETTVGPLRPLNDAKFAAAKPFFEKLGKKFTVLTERDFPIFKKIQAQADPAVTWVRS